MRGDGDLGRHRQEDRRRGRPARRRARRGARRAASRRARARRTSPRGVRRPRPSPTAATAVRPGTRPAVHAVVRDVQRRADEPGRPRGAARVVEHLRPGLRELEPQVVDRERPEPGRVLLRAAHELGEVRDAGPAHEAGRIRMLDRRPSGRQTTSLTAAIQSPTTRAGTGRVHDGTLTSQWLPPDGGVRLASQAHDGSREAR